MDKIIIGNLDWFNCRLCEWYLKDKGCTKNAEDIDLEIIGDSIYCMISQIKSGESIKIEKIN